MNDKGFKTLSHMSEQETIDCMSEHLKKGADIARQLGRLQEKQVWFQVAQLLDRVCHKSSMLATSRGLNRTDTLFFLDHERRKLNSTETIN